MQVYANSDRLTLKTILFFIVVLFIAFLPISSFLFFLKNDAFNGYFPPKFFMSESLHAGYLPLWNPYINFGFPQYGDMSGGYWSPITWLIASTVGYNAYTLTIEVLFYILAGGIGMYKLTSYWQLDKRVRIIAGIAFMCCGYNVGHLQHFNWLSGAAFLPWCLWSYLLLIKTISLKNTVRTALLFYMLVSSAHPGITISAVYFFMAVLLFSFFTNEEKQTVSNRIKKLSITHIVFILTFLLLSTGMITGYLDILPYFLRGEKISLETSLTFPTNIQCWISALIPFATVKNNELYNTDPSMRNCYFSLSLLLFFLLALVSQKDKWQKFLLITGLIFALLSSGGLFKTFAYKFIPFIGYVRLNGEFRIFSLLCFILIAAITLDKFIQQKKKFEGAVKYIYLAIEIILFSCIIYGLYKATNSKESFIYGIKNVFAQNSLAQKLKALVDVVSFYDTLWIQGLIQLFLLWGIKWCLKFSDWGLLKKLVVADMVIACLLNIPYTGVGKASVAQVQAVLNKSPKGIPIPALQPIVSNDSLSTEEKGLTGDWSMYSKQIGVANEVPYPIVLKNMNAYFEYIEKYKDIPSLHRPFIFIAGDTGSVKIVSFDPNQIEVQVEAGSKIILQQNHYPYWHYQNGTEKKEMNKEGINFMSAPIQAGKNNIIFSFEPTFIKWAMLLSLIALILCCLIMVVSYFKPSSPS